ncbi:MAG: MFS transporter [Gammaproteobacteria bacterium]|nr:MFS transporter [Gammaproteobacteria bacterium]
MISHSVLRRFQRVRLTAIGILTVSFMLVFFHRIAPGAIAADLMREFSTTGAALGSLAAMYFYVYTIMQIPAGVLADTLGVRVAATVGALVSGIGSILFGLAPDFSSAAAGRLLVGLGVSVVFVGLMRANTVWWSESRYGIISGLVVFIGNIGGILAAGPLTALLAVASWRTVFVVVGGLTVLIALLTYLFVRDSPQAAGFPSLREMAGKTAHAPRRQHWRHDLHDVLRNAAVWPGFWVNFGLAGTVLAFAGLWGVPFLTDVHGLTRAQASLYTTTMLIGYSLGAFVLGWLSDRLRRRKGVLVGAASSATVMWLCLAWAPWQPGWAGFVIFGLLGFFAAGFVVTFGAAKDVVAPAVAGMAIALVNTGLFFGAAIMQPLFGALMDLSWDGTVVDGVRRYQAADYVNGLWLCIAMATLSMLASLCLRETHGRNITLKEVTPEEL